MSEPVPDEVPDSQVSVLSGEAGEHTEEELADDTGEEVTRETEADINTASRDKLVTFLEEAVNDPDINSVKTRIALIKVALT